MTTTKQNDPEQRFSAFLKHLASHKQIWILTDEHGCVMLNSEDEDCVPVWPTEESAQAFATQEWADCQAQSISLNKWISRWSYGLSDDELAVVVHPDERGEGVIIDPLELDRELKKLK